LKGGKVVVTVFLLVSAIPERFFLILLPERFLISLSG
jgi:hypothetical protein